MVELRREYSAWGEVLVDTNPGFIPFGFAGGVHDEDTKLIRFGAREYDPHLGRWLSRDPSGFGGGSTNLFEYVGGDPVNTVDRSGTFIDALVLAGLALYEAFEIAGSVYDVYDTGKTLMDPCASMWAKGSSLGLFVLGTVGPGNGTGYKLVGKELLEHSRQIKKYGKAGWEEIKHGFIRYVGELKPPRTAGTMKGSRMVREWNPVTGEKRTFYETLDHAENMRIYRPDAAPGTPKVHLLFDEEGYPVGVFDNPGNKFNGPDLVPSGG